jgi:hypothetical protein
MKKILLLVIILLNIGMLQAQTINDGLMMSKGSFCTGFMFGSDRWTNYWEGDLKRDNQNIGTITTKSLMYMGNYGITNKLNVIAMVPYVWTKASMGTLHGMQGVQDLTVALKYNFLRHVTEAGKFKTFVVGSFATPLSNYTPDFLPLSIGLGSTNLSGRFTANYAFKQGLYVNGSAAYTWRSNVTLDRPAYYTDGKLYMTDEVKMPNVFDYSFSVGYIKHGVQTQVGYSQQETLGGGDIRKQDMPFVSNKMNFSKVDFLVMYYLPKPKYLALRGTVSRTVAGRNVGQSTTFMVGVLYTFRFSKEESEQVQ